MRKARHWWVATFWPKSADDFIKVASAMGSKRTIGSGRWAATGELPFPLF